jgi:hypothetical protein
MMLGFFFLQLQYFTRITFCYQIFSLFITLFLPVSTFYVPVVRHVMSGF